MKVTLSTPTKVRIHMSHHDSQPLLIYMMSLLTFSGIDTVVAALGRGVIDSQLLLIKLAAASDSVKWYFPSEYGTDIKYGPQSATEKPHQQKLKVRAYLEGDEEIQKSGLKYTYVVTGPFADGYLRLLGSPEAGGWDVKTKTAWLLEKNNKVSLTTMKEYVHLLLLKHDRLKLIVLFYTGTALETLSLALCVTRLLHSTKPSRSTPSPQAQLKYSKNLSARPEAHGQCMKRLWLRLVRPKKKHGQRTNHLRPESPFAAYGQRVALSMKSETTTLSESRSCRRWWRLFLIMSRDLHEREMSLEEVVCKKQSNSI